MPKMNLHRAQELIDPLRKGTAEGISQHWQARLIEALEYVIEHETQPTPRAVDVLEWCGCEGFTPTMENGKCSACGKNARR